MGETPRPLGYGVAPTKPGPHPHSLGGPTSPWGHLHSLWLTPTWHWGDTFTALGGAPTKPWGGRPHKLMGAPTMHWGQPLAPLITPSSCAPLRIDSSILAGPTEPVHCPL